MERVIIVDENDNPIRICERYQWKDGEIHRSSSLWIANSEGEVLLAQRSLSKKHGAGKWGSAASGTVNEGETYESNIIKEALEEIGLSITPEQLEIGPKELVGQPDNRRLRQWFLVRMDIPLDSLNLQEEEVAAVRWVAADDLEQELVEAPESLIMAAGIFPTLISWSKQAI